VGEGRGEGRMSCVEPVQALISRRIIISMANALKCWKIHTYGAEIFTKRIKKRANAIHSANANLNF